MGLTIVRYKTSSQGVEDAAALLMKDPMRAYHLPNRLMLLKLHDEDGGSVAHRIAETGTGDAVYFILLLGDEKTSKQILGLTKKDGTTVAHSIAHNGTDYNLHVLLHKHPWCASVTDGEGKTVAKICSDRGHLEPNTVVHTTKVTASLSAVAMGPKVW